MDYGIFLLINSDIEIETNKFFLHENYCSRIYTRCKECNNPVEIIVMDEHIQQKHTDFPCQFCQKLFKKDLLKDHLEVCEHRLRQCPYCELEVEDCEMGNHIKQCGAHTEVCCYCNKTFLVRELNGHVKLCEKNKTQDAYTNNLDFVSEQVSNFKHEFESKVSEDLINNLERLDSVTEAMIKFAQMEEDMRLAAEM